MNASATASLPELIVALGPRRLLRPRPRDARSPDDREIHPRPRLNKIGIISKNETIRFVID
jgi:hypothetical protein